MPTNIDRGEVQQLQRQGAQIVEVLPAEDYEVEHLPGAISIPLKILGTATTARLDRGRPVIVYCHDYQ
jgi:rhodanese-related sulfurtransferase